MGENSCIDRCVSKYWHVGHFIHFPDVFSSILKFDILKEGMHGVLVTLSHQQNVTQLYYSFVKTSGMFGFHSRVMAKI